MKNMKRFLVGTLAFSLIIAGIAIPVDAKAKKATLSSTKLTIKVGSSKTLKVKNSSQKAVWSVISGKKVVTLTSKKKSSVKIKAKKSGKSTVQAKLGKQKLKCKVTVKAKAPTTDLPIAPVVTDVPANYTEAPVVTTTPAVTEAPTTTPEATEIKANFVVDKDATIDVYYTQDYTTADETNVTTAVPRNGDTGKADNSGEGQISFKVNAPDGCATKVEVTPKDNYKNLKYPSELGYDGIYRITKITGDVTITVSVEKATQYTGTFVVDEHASVDVFYTQDYSGDPDETNVTSAIARNGDSGEVVVDGKGQINFRVNVDEGYQANVSMDATSEGKYSNLKDSADTLVEGIYRLTKVTGNVVINITTEVAAPAPTETVSPGEPGDTPPPSDNPPEETAAPYTVSFVLDDGISVDVYNTQSYDAASETDVTTAIVRNGTSGEADITGEGQVNFKVKSDVAYEVEVTPTGNFKNLKSAVSETDADIYRVTKVTGDITITVKKKDTSSGIQLPFIPV